MDPDPDPAVTCVTPRFSPLHPNHPKAPMVIRAAFIGGRLPAWPLSLSLPPQPGGAKPAPLNGASPWRVRKS